MKTTNNYPFLLLAALSLFAPISLFAERQIDYDEYTRRLPEMKTHDKSACRKLIQKVGSLEAAVLERITLTDAEKKATDAVRAKLAAMQAKWDAEFAEDLKEAHAMTVKYRFSKGEGVEELYHEWHHKKNKLSQSRPRTRDVMDELLAALGEKTRAAYDEELAKLKFWHGGHGENNKIMPLVEIGVTPQRAFEIFKKYAGQVNENKTRARAGKEPLPVPTWKEILEQTREEVAKGSKGKE